MKIVIEAAIAPKISRVIIAETRKRYLLRLTRLIFNLAQYLKSYYIIMVNEAIESEESDEQNNLLLYTAKEVKRQFERNKRHSF